MDMLRILQNKSKRYVEAEVVLEDVREEVMKESRL